MSYDERIYLQATRGTVKNPAGLPAVLASLVAAQAAHETGNFTSSIFRNFNNAFGYSFSGSAYQTGPGSIADNGQPVAAYRSIEDSTKEIIDWIYRRKNEGIFPADLRTITTPEQYAALLKKANYFTDTLSNYAAGIRNYFVRVLEDLQKPAGQLTAFMVITLSIAVYFMLKRRK